jgi:hypothetical protein
MKSFKRLQQQQRNQQSGGNDNNGSTANGSSIRTPLLLSSSSSSSSSSILTLLAIQAAESARVIPYNYYLITHLMGRSNTNTWYNTHHGSLLGTLGPSTSSFVKMATKGITYYGL